MKRHKSCKGPQAHHGQGPNSYWQVDVDVYLEDDTSDPPKFSIETCLPVNAEGEIVFNNRGRHGFQLLFHLHDLTGKGYCFPGPPHVKDGLWSDVGTECPAGSGQWNEFSTVRVTDNGLTLVVRNLNDTETKFSYVLRVTTDNSHYLPLDPGGDNQNGYYAYQFD